MGTSHLFPPDTHFPGLNMAAKVVRRKEKRAEVEADCGHDRDERRHR